MISALILWAEASSRASFSRRSVRRAVNTRLVPPAANSRASATPIPALAPVTNAHFPFQGVIVCLSGNRQRAYHGQTLRLGSWVGLFRATRNGGALLKSADSDLQ